MEDIASYIAAALIDYAGRHLEGAFRGPTDELTKFAREACEFEVDSTLASDALGILSNCGVATISTDPFAGDYMKIDSKSFDRFVQKARTELDIAEKQMHRTGKEFDEVVEAQALLNAARIIAYRPLERYSEFGAELLTRALDSIKNGPSMRVPASDRIVDLDHNSPTFSEISDRLDELEGRLRVDNDTGELVGEERATALEEVSRLRAWWSSSKIRVMSFVSLAKSTLGWIGEKAASATVGELAKSLLKMVLDLLT
jgi:hypothetical protein